MEQVKNISKEHQSVEGNVTNFLLKYRLLFLGIIGALIAVCVIFGVYTVISERSRSSDIAAVQEIIDTLGDAEESAYDSARAAAIEALSDYAAKNGIAGVRANMVLTDPPYNVNVEESAGSIKNDNMPDEDFYKFLFAAFVNMEQSMASDASIYVFHADSKGLIFRRAFEDAGFYLSGCCIWKKNTLVLGRSPYQWQHEPCLFGWKKGGKHQWYSDRKQTTIWEYDRPRASKDHPTMKPIALMAYPIQNSTMSNCIVLDPFLGSGSTLLACEQTGRICYGVELDPKFVDVIVKRYLEAGGDPSEVLLHRDHAVYSYKEVTAYLSGSSGQ